MNKIFAELTHILASWNIPAVDLNIVTSLILITGIIILAWLSNFITKRIILTFIKHYVDKSKNQYDDVFYKNGVFNRLSQLIPALIIIGTIAIAIPYNQIVVDWISRITYAYMVLVVIITIVAFFNTLSEIYMMIPQNKGKSIKSYIQALNIFIYIIGIFIILSLILHKDISYFITGISAFAAVLLLIFKDSILGLVAGVQLSSNKSVNIGDWIVVPKYGADGTVEEITLNFVKIRNWDKTTSVVPTYALVQDSFINWRGMEESGGRRIKRSLNIDMTSVKFLDEHLIKKLKQVEFITDYLHRKEEELKKYNETHVVNHSEPINGRRMTNLGTFRKYLEEYLSHNENIHKDMTFLIRYLQPGNNGIPIEIYIFSKVQEWAQYEAIQADIFDHILAIIPYFDLRIFQNPSGHDFSKFINQQ